ncbi:MAG: DUF72 domain-containing protein [Actinobacteria bacterium]|nr:DUF72 domain-containing protein [Actinomycetota bacterium]
MEKQIIKGNPYIGTSGFSYNHWKGRFYPEGTPSSEFLKYYAKNFNAVELNITFYRIPRTDTFKNWYEVTPENFRYSLKAPRVITHFDRLKNLEDNAKGFFERIKLLKEKAGCVLWQFPPSFAPETEFLDSFFSEIKKLEGDIRHAVEFRNKYAFNDENIKILKKHNIALVCSHSKRYPLYLKRTADFSYFRFHGPETLYDSRYSEEELDEWIKLIIQFLKSGDVFVFFNNDFSAYAVENATYLKDRIEEIVNG